MCTAQCSAPPSAQKPLRSTHRQNTCRSGPVARITNRSIVYWLHRGGAQASSLQGRLSSPWSLLRSAASCMSPSRSPGASNAGRSDSSAAMTSPATPTRSCAGFVGVYPSHAVACQQCMGHCEAWLRGTESMHELVCLQAHELLTRPLTALSTHTNFLSDSALSYFSAPLLQHHAAALQHRQDNASSSLRLCYMLCAERA